MRRIPDDPWENMSFTTPSTVGVDGFCHIWQEFQVKWGAYSRKLHEFSHDEAVSIEFEHELEQLYFELGLYTDLLIVVACTSIESLVNAAGIHVFSEDFYKKTLQRNEIVGKVQLLVATTNRLELPNSHPMLTKIRELFDRRNALVHPKARQLTPENMENYAIDRYGGSDEEGRDVHAILMDILDFFREFQLLSPQVHSMIAQRLR